jgi:hypothetical protein
VVEVFVAIFGDEVPVDGQEEIHRLHAHAEGGLEAVDPKAAAMLNAGMVDAVDTGGPVEADGGAPAATATPTPTPTPKSGGQPEIRVSGPRAAPAEPSG